MSYDPSEMFEEFVDNAEMDVAEDIHLVEVSADDIDSKVYSLIQDGMADDAQHIFDARIRNMTYWDMDYSTPMHLVGTYYMINGGTYGFIPANDYR